MPPSCLNNSRAPDSIDDNLSVPESLKRQVSRRGYGGASSACAITPLEPSTAASKANSVFDSGPRSRGLPYASTNVVAKP